MQITLTISSSIAISPLSRAVAEAVRPLLTMPNPQYAAALRRGYSVRGIPREIHCYHQSPNQLEVPRGFLPQLPNLLMDMGIKPEIRDLRQSLPPLGLRFRGELRGYQENSIDALLQYDSAVLSAPTGSGKTVMALAAVARRDQPFAVVVHTRELLDQWVAQAEKFLGIKPGVVAAGKFKPGREGTIALVQTLYKDPGRLAKKIGLLVVDEVHRCPSRIFSEALAAFDCRHVYGFSATPHRADGLTPLIHWHIGPLAHEVGRRDLEERGAVLRAVVIPRATDFATAVELAPPSYSENYDPGKDYGSYGGLVKELTMNRERNLMIAGDIVRESRNGTCLVITDRKGHALELAGMVRGLGVACECLTGDSDDRAGIVARVRTGQVRAVAATAQLIGEGFDCRELCGLFLAMPVKAGRTEAGGEATRLIQYLGRVLRPAPGKEFAVVYDYYDPGVPVLMRAWRSRLSEYRKLGWEVR